MNTYILRYTSTTYYTQEVKANSEEEARKKVFDIPIDYDYTSGVRRLISIKEEV